MKAAKTKLAAAFSPRHRGLLLDVVVFLANVFLMRLLMRIFLELVNQAGDDIYLAQLVLFAGCAGIYALPPVGATLKRWSYHERLRVAGTEPKDSLARVGCLFNPILYFCLVIVIYAGINAFLIQIFFEGKDPGGAIFGLSILFGLVLSIVNTYLVYRYFSPPKPNATSKFLSSPGAEIAGDACLFINMILFQVIWNWLTMVVMHFERVSSFSEFAGRLFYLSFLSLLIYFPPRMFYLAEDIKRPRTWLFILLANSPVIVRVMIGSAADGGW